MEPCPFCQILEKDNLNQIIKQGKYVTAIYKLTRGRNVNFLIIPNRHIVNLKEYDKKTDAKIMNEIIMMANELSGGRDWSLHINNGKKSDQTVFHLHAHITSNEQWKTWGL